MQLEENNQKMLMKEGRLKRYRNRVKQYKQNLLFNNNEREFYQNVVGECPMKNQQPDENEAK